VERTPIQELGKGHKLIEGLGEDQTGIRDKEVRVGKFMD